jgi:hypothetical protein
MESTAVARVTESQQALGLARVSDQISGWYCAEFTLRGADELHVRFASLSSQYDSVEVTISKRGTAGKVFRVLNHCQIFYAAKIGQLTNERRDEVGKLVMGVGQSIDDRLELDPTQTIAQALGRRDVGSKLVLSVEGLLALLAPNIMPGAPIVGGWSLVDIRPSSLRKLNASKQLEWIVAFEHEQSRATAFFSLSPRVVGDTAHWNSAHLAITPVDGRGVEAPAYKTLQSFFVFQIQLNDHEGMEIEIPAEPASAAPRSQLVAIKNPQQQAGPVVLSISSECGQSCRFCSFKEAFPIEDGGDPALMRYVEELAEGRRKGSTLFLINGVDPLSFSGILDLIQTGRDLGYERASLYSPCTLLADRDFCQKVLERLPRHSRVFVPIYGIDDATHDAVVDTPGAHRKVMKALEHLREFGWMDRVTIVTVVTKINLHAIPDVIQFARSRGLFLTVQQPYPNADLHTDRYYQVALTQTLAVEALTKHLPRSIDEATPTLEGIAPCVTFRRMRDLKVRPQRWVDTRRTPDYMRGFPRSLLEPCPHAASCSLAPVCSKEVFRSYTSMFGWNEFQPVTLSDLMQVTDARDDAVNPSLTAVHTSR